MEQKTCWRNLMHSKHPEILIALGFVPQAANQVIEPNGWKEYPPTREDRKAALKSEYYVENAGPVPRYVAVRPCILFPHGYIVLIDDRENTWVKKCTKESEFDSIVKALKENNFVPATRRKCKAEI